MKRLLLLLPTGVFTFVRTTRKKSLRNMWLPLKAPGLALALIAMAGLPGLSGLFGGEAQAQAAITTNAEEFLHPDEAFRLSVERIGSGYRAVWNIANEYYLYRDKISVRVAGDKIKLELPPGEVITDEFFGETEVFRYRTEVGFTPVQSADTIEVVYQGCADAGLCYSPVTKQIALASLSAVPAASETGMAGGATVANGMADKDARDGGGQSVQDRVLALLQGESTAIILLSFLAFGLLLSVTPCVLPIIPILLSTLMQGGPKTPVRAASLSGVFVLAMAAVYSLLGVATGLLGESVQAWFQTPWVIGLFAGVFVLLALAMFGLFSLQMPAFIQSRLATATSAGRGGSIPGAALMGAGTALIIGPCVTPALIGALLFIAQTRDALLGGMALFILALGMGIPLIVAGTSLGKLLPKPGTVRETANVIIGFLLLGVAIWLLDRVVSSSVTVLSVGTWLVLFGEYIRRACMTSNRGDDARGSPAAELGRAAGVVLFLYGAVLVVGAATGGDRLLKPLAHIASSGGRAPAVTGEDLPFRSTKSLREVREAIRVAATGARPTMLYVHAEWCVSCKELKAFTFSDEDVRRALADVQLLDFDVTENDDKDKAMMKAFSLFGPPGILFFLPSGAEVPSARIVGFVPADEFVTHIRRVKGQSML